MVYSVDEAIEHINRYNTGHSEAIITNSYENAQKFLDEVDAAAVYVNASTRFTDGFEFGYGAEIGISTQKLHGERPHGTSGSDNHQVYHLRKRPGPSLTGIPASKIQEIRGSGLTLPGLLCIICSKFAA